MPTARALCQAGPSRATPLWRVRRGSAVLGDARLHRLPGPDTVRYGGNTSCVGITAADGTQLVLDAGTGARAYGNWLLQGPARRRQQHAPLDHAYALGSHSGLPVLRSGVCPRAVLAIYGTPRVGADAGGLAGRADGHTYFPVNMHELRAKLRFQDAGEGWFRVGGVDVRAQFLNHPSALGYRLHAGGVSVVYATDHEPFWWGGEDAPPATRLAHPGDARHAEFLRGADLLIHDVQYLASEYPQRRGWGHSVLEYVVDLACLTDVKRLALFHHDPGRTDAELDALVTPDGSAPRATARRWPGVRRGRGAGRDAAGGDGDGCGKRAGLRLCRRLARPVGAPRRR